MTDFPDLQFIIEIALGVFIGFRLHTTVNQLERLVKIWFSWRDLVKTHKRKK